MDFARHRHEEDDENEDADDGSANRAGDGLLHHDELGPEVFANALLVADTSSTAREDHTFSGIMFPLVAKSVIPLDEIVVHSIDVRGGLGDMHVFTSTRSLLEAYSDASQWSRIYVGHHSRSWQNPQPLVLDPPLVIKPDQTVSIYVHSTAPGDSAIIYDNSGRKEVVYEDNAIRLLSGLAHVSNEPFSTIAPWGGSAWRPRRAFVGRLVYSFRPVLWQPRTHNRYPSSFKQVVRSLLVLNMRIDTPLGRLGKDVLFYIIGYFQWDDFESLVSLLFFCAFHLLTAQRVRNPGYNWRRFWRSNAHCSLDVKIDLLVCSFFCAACALDGRIKTNTFPAPTMSKLW